MAKQLPQSGWTGIDNLIVDQIHEIGPMAFAVYVVIARHAGANSEAWPSIDRVAQLCGSSRRTIHRSLDRLQELGLIKTKPRAGRSSIYQLIKSVGLTPCSNGTQKKSKEEDKRGSSSEDEQSFIDLFNSASMVTQVRGTKLSDKRRKALRSRLKDSEWWTDFLEAVKKFPLKIQQGRVDPWKPDADWILKPDSVAKILEGKYDFSTNDSKNKIRPVSAGVTFDPNANAETTGDPSFGTF